MKKIILSAAIAFGTFIMASCQSQTSSSNSKQINVTIPVEEFSKKLTELKDVQLVDVRTPEEYQEGHLKNSVNYNLNGSDFENQLNKLDKNKPVMVYCLGGGRSAEAAEMMKEKGFTQVYNMQGGIMKWNAANMPIDKGNTPVAANENKGMTLEEFNKQVQSDKYVIVDFNAKWCKPCKKIVPMLESLSEKKKDKLILLRVDADENKTLLTQKNISAIPYLELYKDGKLIWKHEGDIDEATLLKETKL
jgi:rhodanese-related sulfurtransferase